MNYVVHRSNAADALRSDTTDRRVAFIDLDPAIEGLREAALAGLSLPQKAIPPKFIYDAQGAALFERICTLPEYYPTRSEIEILRRHARDIADRMGPHAQLVEYGAGAAEKVRALLSAMERPERYVAIDVAREQLRAVTSRLAAEYPELGVTAICADYTQPVPLPQATRGARVGFFPGSTIGNFTHEEAVEFLRAAARTLAGGALLIGVDLKKEKARLDAAYNDSAGITAAFILNILGRMNRELGADFDLGQFAYVGEYSEENGRVEMFVQSRIKQRVIVAGQRFEFAAGEKLHVEYSCKYDAAEFQELARRAGFAPSGLWIDHAGNFSVHYLLAPPTGGAG
ncbi:MAG: L-histidine N(alpha)-methyltransferase [Rhodospirillales bacterium]